MKRIFTLSIVLMLACLSVLANESAPKTPTTTTDYRLQAPAFQPGPTLFNLHRKEGHRHEGVPQWRIDAAQRVKASMAAAGYDSVEICMYCACTLTDHLFYCPYFVPTPALCFMHPLKNCIWYDPQKLLPGGGGDN